MDNDSINMIFASTNGWMTDTNNIFECDMYQITQGKKNILRKSEEGKDGIASLSLILSGFGRIGFAGLRWWNLEAFFLIVKAAAFVGEGNLCS